MLSRGKPGLHDTFLDGAGRFSISRVVDSGSSKMRDLCQPSAISWGETGCGGGEARSEGNGHNLRVELVV